MHMHPGRHAATIAALMIAGLAGRVSAQTGSVGLSPVRAQLFGQDSVPTSPVRAEDYFASALAVADFNDDGADDLALGVPYADGPFGSEVPNQGLVVVRYGEVGRGLAGEDGEALTRSLFPAYEHDDLFGAALAACDFDGDGFADLAIGAPFETLGPTLVTVGAVTVVFGAAGGLDAQRFQVFDELTPGIPLSPPGNNQRFGAALACGDFDGDGNADLAVGAPWHRIAGKSLAGAVFVLPGSSAGLVATASFELDEGQGAVTGEAEESDLFGWALAAGDLDGDGRADLAVGVPGQDVGAGAFHVFFGTPNGLSRTDGVYLDESGVGGLSEVVDFFATAFSVGDFDGDGRDDLVVGIPWENLETASGTIRDGGQVAVLYGAAGGFDLGRTQLWSQDSIFGVGTSEPDDWFGWAMAAADFDHDGRDDLAVGSPKEFVTGPGDGAASVLMGSATGLVATRRRGIASGLEGWPGNASEHGRELSTSLAAGDFDGDGHADLVLGAPFEDRSPTLIDTGTATVVYGSLFSDGFETGDRRYWPAGSP